MNPKLILKSLLLFSIFYFQTITTYAQIDHEVVSSENIELIKNSYQKQMARGVTMPEIGFRGEWSPYAFFYLNSINYPNREDFENKVNFREAKENWLTDHQYKIDIIQGQIALYNEKFTKDYKSGLFK